MFLLILKILKIMNKYIIEKLAGEHKIDKKHVDEIIDGFYRGLRYYLEHKK